MLPEVPHQTNKPGESISNSPEQLWNTSSPTLKCNLGLKAASSKSSPQRRSSMQAYCLPRMTALTDIARILATLLILLLQVCHEDDYENEAQNLEQCFFFCMNAPRLPCTYNITCYTLYSPKRERAHYTCIHIHIYIHTLTQDTSLTLNKLERKQRYF